MKKPAFRKMIAALVAIAGGFLSTNAQTVLYDGFVLDGAPYSNSNGVFLTIDVAPNVPTGKNGGSGFANGWQRWGVATGNTNRLSTETPGLTYVDSSLNALATLGGALRNYARLSTPPNNTDTIQNQEFYRQLWVGGPASGDTVYFSFLADVRGNAQINMGFNNGATNAANLAVNFSLVNGNIGVNMQDANNAVFTADTGVPWVNSSVTKLFVGRIQNYAQTNQRLDFWLDPFNITDITSVPPTVTLLSSNGVAGKTFDYWRHSAGATGNGYLDELRLAYGVGASFTNVLPIALAPHKVRVETAADGSGVVVGPQNITAGDSITVYAIGRDASDAFVANVPAVWTMEAETDGVADSDLSVSPDGKSAVFTANLAGTGTILATAPTSGSGPEQSGTITVLVGAATQVRVETSPDGLGTVVPGQLLASGTPLTVYSIARDAGGNFIGNVPATWSLVNKLDNVADGDLVPAGDNLSATLTGNLAGKANIRAVTGALASVDSGVITVSFASTWVGDGTVNNWDFVTANWATNGVPGDVFRNAQDAVFDDTGDNTVPIQLTGPVLPRLTSITGSKDYSFSGPGKISSGNLVHSGTGRVVITTDNDSPGNTVAETAGGILQIGAGGTTGRFNGGAVSINNGAALHYNRTDPIGAPFVVTNSVSGNADFQLVVNSGAVRVVDSAENNGALGVVKTNATLILAKPANRGLGRFASSGAYSMTIEPGGTIQLGGPGTGQDQISTEGLRNNLIDGLFDLNGSSEGIGGLEGVGIIDNSGSAASILTAGLSVNDFSTRTFAGQFKQTGSGTLGFTATGNNTLYLDGNSTATGPFLVTGGCTLGGTGVISGPLTIAATGTLVPGSPAGGAIGTFGVNNSLTLQGITSMEIDRGATPNSDRISGITTITYGGELNVANFGGNLENGDSFQLFSFSGSASGDFTATNLPALDPGLVWKWNPTTGILAVGTPAPAPAGLTNVIAGNDLVLTWPNGEGWQLQVQTNALTVGLSNNWSVVPGATSPFTNAINPANGAVFYRLVFP
jgi:hypothetical protein